MPKKLSGGNQVAGVYEISDQGDLVLVSKSLRAHLMKSLYPHLIIETSDEPLGVSEKTSLDNVES